jgi:tape measure domain-containing protein
MSDQSDWAVRLIDRVTGPAKNMQGAVGRLTSSLKRMVAGADKSREEMGRFVKGSGGMLEGFASSFKGLGGKLEAGFVSAIGKVKEGMIVAGTVAVGVGAALVAATVKTADFAQTAILGFKAVAKHGASAEKLFQHSRDLAEELGLDVFATSKQFTKLLALQFNPAMATDLIKMGSDMRALGTDAEGVDRILAQLGQIQAKGRLQGEELTVLAENGLSTQLVYKKLGEQLGKTKDEILKMQAAGTLTSEMAFPAIMAAVMAKTGEKKLGDVGKSIADTTLSGMAGRLKAQAQNLWIDIGRQATPAIMSVFTDLQTELRGVLGNKSLAEGVIMAVETIAGVVKDGIPFVRQFIASFTDGFSAAWPAIKNVLGTLFEGFGSGATWMDTVREFATILGKVVAFGVGVAAVFGGMVAAGLQVTSNVVSGLIFLWDGLIKGIGAAMFWVDDFFANLGAKWDALDFGAIAKSIIDGLVNGIRNGISSVVAAVGDLGTATVSSLKNVLGIHSPSKEFAWLGEMSGAGFNEGLQNSFDTVGPRVGSLTTGAANDFGGMSGGGSSGPLLHIDNVNIAVGGGGTDARQQGREAALGFEEQLSSLVERLRLEAAA